MKPLPCQCSVQPTTRSPCRAISWYRECTSTRWSRCRSQKTIAWIQFRIVAAVVARHFCQLWHSNESGYSPARHASHHHQSIGTTHWHKTHVPTKPVNPPHWFITETGSRIWKSLQSRIKHIKITAANHLHLFNHLLESFMRLHCISA